MPFCDSVSLCLARLCIFVILYILAHCLCLLTSYSGHFRSLSAVIMPLGSNFASDLKNLSFFLGYFMSEGEHWGHHDPLGPFGFAD